MASIKEMARELYEYEGYSVRESKSSKSPLDLIAAKKELFHKDRVGVIVKDGFVSRDYVKELSREISDLDVNRGVVFGKGHTENVQDFASKHNIDVTSREELLEKLKEAGLRSYKRVPKFPKIPVLVSVPYIRLKDMFFKKLAEYELSSPEVVLRNVELTLMPFWAIDYKVYKKRAGEKEKIEESGIFAVSALAATEYTVPEELFDKRPLEKDGFVKLGLKVDLVVKDPVVTEESGRTFMKHRLAERYNVDKSDVVTSGERTFYISDSWRFMYSFRGKVYKANINGLHGVIEKIEVPTLTQKEASDLALNYVKERYDDEDLDIENVNREDGMWKATISSREKEYLVGIGVHNSKIVYSKSDLLRKNAINTATLAVKEKHEEGELELKDTNKGAFDWSIEMSTKDRVYDVKIDNATGDVRDISFYYTKEKLFELVKEDLKKSHEVRSAELTNVNLNQDTWTFGVNSKEGQFTVNVDRKTGKILEVKLEMSENKARDIANRHLAKHYSEQKPILEKTNRSVIKKDWIVEFHSEDMKIRYKVRVDKNSGKVKKVSEEKIRSK